VSSITSHERDFIRNWCTTRNVDHSYAIRALLYWLRVKSHISVFFLLKKNNRELYMVICIHLSMKWQGYDEMFKCTFIKDLREIDIEISPVSQQDMEFQVLKNLNWNLGP